MALIVAAIVAASALVPFAPAVPATPARPAATGATGATAVPSPEAPSPGVPGVPGLSPEVAALPASSRDLDRARSTRDAAVATRDRDLVELDGTRASREIAQQQQQAEAALLGRRRQELVKVDQLLLRRRAAVRVVASEWYMTGNADQRAMDPTLGASELAELRRQAVLGDAAADAAGSAVVFLSGRRGDLSRDIDQLERSTERVGGRLEELSRREQELTTAVAADEVAVTAADAAVAAARLNATIDGTDMSTVAVDAYWRAQNRLALTDPGCRIGWWALAGIGRTESRHGTYLGSAVGVDGRVEPPIVGPPLDGSNGFRRVPDSDGGVLDGDVGSDRAVGPMQFLPGTWRTVGADGNGDGTADPDNIYDAAVGAGVYLCRSGDLSSEPALRGAYLTYNRSLSYVDTVFGFATAYRDAVALP